MKLLIYTVAVGETYHKLARMMIASLRAVGYKGQVAVLTEKTELFTDIRGLTVVRIPAKNAKAMKSRILEFCPGYERYFFVDSDILWTGNPSLFGNDGDIIATPNNETLAQAKLKPYGQRYCLQYMNEDQFKRWQGEDSFCSGQFSVGVRAAQSLFKHWSRIMADAPTNAEAPLSDQAAFQVAARLSREEGFGFVPCRRNAAFMFGRHSATQGTAFVSGTTCLIHAYNPYGGNRLGQFRKAIEVASKANLMHDFSAQLDILAQAADSKP